MSHYSDVECSPSKKRMSSVHISIPDEEWGLLFRNSHRLNSNTNLEDEIELASVDLTRLANQSRRPFKRNDKVCTITFHLSSTKLMWTDRLSLHVAHLVNQAVAHEIITLQIMVLHLERSTHGSIKFPLTLCAKLGWRCVGCGLKVRNTRFELNFTDLACCVPPL